MSGTSMRALTIQQLPLYSLMNSSATSSAETNGVKGTSIHVSDPGHLQLLS